MLLEAFLFAATAFAAPKDSALVVLGAGSGVEGWANPILVERVCKGVELWRAGRAPRIIVSGGYTAGHIAEADLMRAAAVAMGVPADAIVREDSSVTTAENADFTRLIAERLHARRLTVVTHRSHLQRALGEFQRAGGGRWTLDGAEADGALSTACFRGAWPASLPPGGTSYDMLIVDVGVERTPAQVAGIEDDVPSPQLLHAVAGAVAAYRAGRAKHLYFAEPVLSTITARGILGEAHGHISETELARIVATAMGASLDDVFISSGRRFGQVSGAVEPEDAPWQRLANPRVAIEAPAAHRQWWSDLFSKGLNASLPRPEYLEP